MISRIDKTTIPGTLYIGTWTDKNIPIYSVTNANSLNQLVGYIRHINSEHGTVLYRGQCKLYESITPSIQHDNDESIRNANKQKLLDTIDVICTDQPLLKFFNFNTEKIAGWEAYRRLVIEAVLQHYGAKTFSVDFVDNHWTALWFGLYEWDMAAYTYKKRDGTKKTGEDSRIKYNESSVCFVNLPEKPPIATKKDLTTKQIEECWHIAKCKGVDVEIIEQNFVNFENTKRKKEWELECKNIQKKRQKIVDIYEKDNKDGHMFLFLYVAETNVPSLYGVSFGQLTNTIDLRKAVPSTFLRPCAQHGWIVRGRQEDYKYEDRIACVIRISIPLVTEMLGDGTLVKMENFFPSPKHDYGYNVLLGRQKGTGSGKYTQIIPAGTIPIYNYTIEPEDET